MGIYTNGRRDHADAIMTFSVENGMNLGDMESVHPGWEIVFGGTDLRGLAITLDSRAYRLDEAGGLVYNAEEPHHEHFRKANLRFDALVFRESFVKSFLGESVDTGNVRFDPMLDEGSAFVENARRTYEVIRNQVIDEGHLQCLAESLLVDLLESSVHNRKDLLRKIHMGSTRMLVKEILAEIHMDAFEDDFDLDSLADRLGTTKFHIIRTMKSHLGVTPYGYVRRLRLQRAERLLSTTGSSISQIAFECGFAETSAFNKAFKSWKGMAPSKFRRGGSPSTDSE